MKIDAHIEFVCLSTNIHYHVEYNPHQRKEIGVDSALPTDTYSANYTHAA
jgi:hypothetical protein